MAIRHPNGDPRMWPSSVSAYRANERPPGVTSELHEEGQLIALFNSRDIPLHEGMRLTLVQQCGAVVAPARLVVDAECALFFRVVRLYLGCESLLPAYEPGGVAATFFPPLPSAEADVRAPWRNLLPKTGSPGMQFSIEIECLWNVAPDSRPFTAGIYGCVLA